MKDELRSGRLRSKSAAITCLLCTLWLTTGCSFRVETFVLESGTSHGWVTIEQGNSTCPALPDGGVFRTTVIPQSRFICTSTPTHYGWSYERFYLANPDGSHTKLELGDLVRLRSWFAVGELGRPCNFSGIEFFYGTADEVVASNPLLQDKAYLAKYHPDCPGAQQP